MSYFPLGSPSTETPPQIGEDPRVPVTFLPGRRSNNRTSTWSDAHSPRVSNLAPPRFSRSTSARRTHRSASLASSVNTARGLRDDRGLLSEEDEDDNVDADDVDNSDNDDLGSRPRPRHNPKSLADDDDERDLEDDPVTLKERQSLINVEHPFGLPIWKPALYKKSRTVTRDAETALHSQPSAAAQKVLLPGNVVWTLLFGWWLAIVCFAVASILALIPGARNHAWFVLGLGWYLLWPFGKYVEGDVDSEEDEAADAEEVIAAPSEGSQHSASADTVRAAHPAPEPSQSTITQRNALDFHPQHLQSMSWNPPRDEFTSLLASASHVTPSKHYGSTPRAQLRHPASHWLPTVCFWLLFVSIIAPLMLLVCLICWGLVFTIPMAKLNWELLKLIFSRSLSIRFCSPPAATVVPADVDASPAAQASTLKAIPIQAGQAAPSGASTVLLCVYRGMGTQYYKYTVGGVNILFINLLPVVFLLILDDFLLLPIVEYRSKHGLPVSSLIAFLASRAFIFLLGLLSVIPLSYFIGMAVASISAQSSIGMGAVINATFGSIIEIILYSIALTQGKGHLVEGSIIGSLLAGVLLMPGASMVSGAVRQKEMKFNAKSAGVTSTMLIMAIIGTLTPTLFYQTYGNFELVCHGCPSTGSSGQWGCKRCYYQHPNPVEDPFYQETVKSLMYFCAGILLFSYLIGLWFSLRTHASQIWQNPQPLMHPLDIGNSAGTGRMSMYHRLLSAQLANAFPSRRPLSRKTSMATTTGSVRESHPRTAPDRPSHVTLPPPSPTVNKRISYANSSPAPHVLGYTPLLETVNHAVQTGIDPQHLPENMSQDELTRVTRAVAVATVSALRDQHDSPVRTRASGTETHYDAGHGGHGGHEAPAWSRFMSASVLIACTALYAIVAEILVDVVDVVLEGSSISEKFLGVTLFALVPNTTEFMNAMSFALNGNIALSMEIGSAYALQVCLLQIPAMVAFSAWYDPRHMGSGSDTFTLIFPRWDVIAIILSVFLLTYTYIEAKSNYHRGSILILSYFVLMAGFFYAPHNGGEVESLIPEMSLLQMSQTLFLSLWTR